MLKKRLIPVLVLRDGMVVQSIRFRHTNVIHWQPATAVDFFDRWAVDEMAVLDVSRDRRQRRKFYQVLEGLSRKCFVPLMVGGWVESAEEMRQLLRLGADKVTLNTGGVRDPQLICRCAREFGSQCVVISIDVKDHGGGRYEVYIDRGREATRLTPFDWARKAEALGAGEIFLNCIERDGFRQGYDLDLLKGVVQEVTIPVIAMGGVFTWQHLAEGILVGGAEAVAAANIFHYTEHSTKKAKDYLIRAGVDIRSGVRGVRLT